MKAHLYFIFLVIAILCVSTVNAYAYIDPGVGSLVIQAAAGTILIAGMAIKTYWKKIKLVLTRK